MPSAPVKPLDRKHLVDTTNPTVEILPCGSSRSCLRSTASAPVRCDFRDLAIEAALTSNSPVAQPPSPSPLKQPTFKLPQQPGPNVLTTHRQLI